MFRRLFDKRETPSDSALKGMPVDHGDRPGPGPSSPGSWMRIRPGGGFVEAESWQ